MLPTGIRIQETEKRALAGAGRADDGQDVACTDLDDDVLHRFPSVDTAAEMLGGQNVHLVASCQLIRPLISELMSQ
jgi:hypothetical protein